MSGRKLIVGLSCLLLASAAAWAAEVQPAPAVDADGPAALDGMTCVSDRGYEKPEIGTPGPAPEGAGGIPNCPTNFSNCVNVPGRKCTLQNCVTIDLGYDSCRKNGHVLTCTSGNLQQTTCDCRERLHQICCDDGNCEFGECGFCTGGSLTTVCPQ